MDDYTVKIRDLQESAANRALDALLQGREAALVTEERARVVLTVLAGDVAAGVADMARVSLVDTATAAQMLGISARRVRALAVSRHLGWQTARDWVFTPEDIEAMRVRVPGRPATR